MKKGKTALITGVTGQDGSYLAELLLEKNYQVVGLIRRNSHSNFGNASHLCGQMTFAYGDVTDSVSLVETIKKYEPDEIYNLAAQSHVGISWKQPFLTEEITGVGAQRVFEAVRQATNNKQIRVYQASSSEMFGQVHEIPQNEKTPFRPANPYAACKLYAHSQADVYRQSYQMHISCGILFNHESPRRGMNFVTQKVTYGAACASLGIKNPPELNEENEPIVKNGKIALGNLESERDWGFAGDYVEAMWLMLQQTKPDDYVIATGIGHTIKELCETAYNQVGMDYRDFIYVDKRFVRPAETGPLIGDAQKAKKILRWKPKTSFEELIKMMIDAHIAKLK